MSLMPQHLVAATKVSLIDINQSKRTPMTMEPVTCSGLRKCCNSKMGHTFRGGYGSATSDARSGAEVAKPHRRAFSGNHFRRYFFMSALARFSPSVVWFSLENSASRTLAAHLLCILHPNALARCWSQSYLLPATAPPSASLHGSLRSAR